MSKATALIFHLVLARKSLQPESAKLGLHLSLPCAFVWMITFKRATFFHFASLVMLDWLAFTDLLCRDRRHELVNIIKGEFFCIRVAEAISRGSCGWSGLRGSLINSMLALGKLEVKHWDLFLLKTSSCHFWRSCEILNPFGWDIDWDSNLVIRWRLESALSAQLMFNILCERVLSGCYVTGWSLNRLENWALLLRILHVLSLETLCRLGHIVVLFTLVIEEWFGTIAVCKTWHWWFVLKRCATRKVLLEIALYVHLLRWNKWFDLSHLGSWLTCNFLKCIRCW